MSPGLVITFRVLAWLTGLALLVLVFVAMPLKYVADEPGLSDQVGVVHGMALYPAYVIVAFVLGYQARWSLIRTVLIILAGTVPFMSFVAERSVLRRVRASEQPPAPAPAPPA